MSLLEQTYRNQSALANYCRTGTLEDIPGINVENIGHYRRMVFNVIDDMLQSAFPLSYMLFTLLILGPGKASLDELIRSKSQRTEKV